MNLERKTKKQQTIKQRRATKEQQPPPRGIVESSLLLRFARLLHPTSPLPHPSYPLPPSPFPIPLPHPPTPSPHPPLPYPLPQPSHVCSWSFLSRYVSGSMCSSPWPKNGCCFKLPPPLQKITIYFHFTGIGFIKQ